MQESYTCPRFASQLLQGNPLRAWVKKAGIAVLAFHYAQTTAQGTPSNLTDVGIIVALVPKNLANRQLNQDWQARRVKTRKT